MILKANKSPCLERLLKHICCVMCILLVAGCASKSRYSMEHDIGPGGSFDASGVPNAQPIWEPLSRQGNKETYIVRGVKYKLADISKGFKEKGIASWYGLKFHGELTSNGETYNMYSMSAAHKHLPLPSYVRVTNLNNNKSVVVRVNDRGPFHEGRVIDLSYAAATKLGFAKQGTAPVIVELIKMPAPSHIELGTYNADKVSHFIQVAAFSSFQSAENIKNQLIEKDEILNAFVATDSSGKNDVHRVRIGPFKSEKAANHVRRSLKKKGFHNAILIQRALSAKDI